jgi:hypothetical protein
MRFLRRVQVPLVLLAVSSTSAFAQPTFGTPAVGQQYSPNGTLPAPAWSPPTGNLGPWVVYENGFGIDGTIVYPVSTPTPPPREFPGPTPANTPDQTSLAQVTFGIVNTTGAYWSDFHISIEGFVGCPGEGHAVIPGVVLGLIENDALTHGGVYDSAACATSYDEFFNTDFAPGMTIWYRVTLENKGTSSANVRIVIKPSYRDERLNALPEPSTFYLIATGLIGLLVMRGRSPKSSS